MANNLFNIFRRKAEEPKEEPKEERSIFGDFGLLYNSNSSYSNTKAMKISAAYACTNILSNSVALLPIKVIKYVNGRKIEVQDHPLNKILNLTPNNKYNKFNFFKLLMESIILNGNGYVYINRDDRLNVKSLELINPEYVQPMVQEDGSVKYIIAGMETAVDSANVIHLFQHCDEMFNGISVIKYADMVLNAAWNSDTQADKFFRGGSGLMGVLKASAPLTEAQKSQIAQSWEKSISRTTGGGVAILPQGIDFQSISVSPEDAQLLESRQYNVIEIARMFNVSPLKIYDYSHMSYSSLEQVALSYLQDSVLPYVQLFEDEFNRKVFKPSEIGKYAIDFDFSAIVQADKKAEVEYYRALLTNGVLSIDEVRDKLGYSPLEDKESGSAHFIQVSYGNLKDVVEGNFIKQQQQNPNTEQDNKLNNKEE